MECYSTIKLWGKLIMINQIIKKIEYPVIKMVLFVEFIYYFMYHEILPFLPPTSVCKFQAPERMWLVYIIVYTCTAIV